MATNTAGTVGQEYHTNQVHYVGKTITFADDDLVVPIGQIPPGAVVIGVGVVVTAAFSANSVLDIGTSTDPDAYATAIVMTTAGRILDASSDPILSNDDYSATAALTIVASLTSSGTISAGSGYVYATYLVPRS